MIKMGYFLAFRSDSETSTPPQSPAASKLKDLFPLKSSFERKGSNLSVEKVRLPFVHPLFFIVEPYKWSTLNFQTRKIYKFKFTIYKFKIWLPF